MREREDVRQQRTKSLLARALMELAQTKPISDITIKELVDRAQVTRSTFYRNFYDKDDFVEKLCNDMLDQYKRRVRDFDRLPVKESIEQRGIAFFEHIAENADFYRVMLGPNGVPSFRTMFERVGHEYFRERYMPMLLESMGASVDQMLRFGILEQYVVSAKCGIVEYWLSEGMRLSPRYLADITSKYVLALVSEEIPS